MNNLRRGLLDKALKALDDAEEYVNSVLDEEQDCLSNIPESFEGTDRYNKMESAIDSLESALDSISDARSQIDSASE